MYVVSIVPNSDHQREAAANEEADIPSEDGQMLSEYEDF